MKLYLMRHGQAASPEQDPQQGLTPAGQAAVEQLAEGLLARGISFSQAWHSDKTRARQTATIMCRILVPALDPQQRDGLKPNDDPRALLPELERLTDDTLLVSHLPFIPNLLNRLTGELQSIVLAPGTLVCLGRDNGQWQIDWVESP